MKKLIVTTVVVLAGSAIALASPQAPGTVIAKQKISETNGGFGGILDSGDEFGAAAASLGDLDGDGIGDLALGAYRDDDGGADQGAVWILFLDTDGTVKSHQKISETDGGFGGTLDPGDTFGLALCCLGDLDGDGSADLAVGAQEDDDGGVGNEGAVWILFLNANGTVKAHQKISATAGGFGGTLDPSDLFSSGVSAIGDLDGDGVVDLAVGARNDDDGGTNQGAVWILFLNTNGTVKAHQKISETTGGFAGALDADDYFGMSVSGLGDLDGDGIEDLAVGAAFDDDGGMNKGAAWILFLDTDGTVKSEQKISSTAGGFGSGLDGGDNFGQSVAKLGDLDGDLVGDLVVGSPFFGTIGASQGAVWILFLHTDGTVKARQRISAMTGGFGAGLDSGDAFGWSAVLLDDLDGDGTGDLAVGAIRDDDGGSNQGAAWILFLAGDTLAPELTCPPSVTVSDRRGSPPGEIVFFSVTATDASDPSPTVVCVPPSGSFFPQGTTIVTCTATDASGNESMCMFPVVVQPPFRNERL